VSSGKAMVHPNRKFCDDQNNNTKKQKAAAQPKRKIRTMVEQSLLIKN
jgi:hypothetical protein